MTTNAVSKKKKTHPTQSNNQTEELTTMSPTHANTSQAIVPTTHTALPLVFVSAPPASANIPGTPAGFVFPKGTSYRAVLPKKVEVVVLADAVMELRSFVDFAGTLGKTVPSQAEVVASFDAASRWSVMRDTSDAWDKYSMVQEGIAWTGVRAIMARLKPAFELAAAGDPAIATTYPKLAALLDAKKSIAKRGATTRAANKAAIAKGEPASHGAAGKKRRAAADKAIVAAAASPHAAPVTQTTTEPAPKEQPAPVVASAAPGAVANSAPVANGAPAASTVATNGAAVVNGTSQKLGKNPHHG